MRLTPGPNVIKLSLPVIYGCSYLARVFVPGKLFQPSLTNTNFLQKFVNYGRKKLYNIGPWAWILFYHRLQRSGGGEGEGGGGLMPPKFTHTFQTL